MVHYSNKILIADIRSTLGMSGTSAKLDKAYDGFKKYNYSVIKKDHNNFDVVNQLVGKKPVFMSGFDGNFIDLHPEGHAWVCDGVISNISEFEYYVEYLNTINEYSNYGITLMENPGMCSGSSYTTFHMNWGWGRLVDENNNIIDVNGWYTSATPLDWNFSSSRQNLYVTPN